MILAGKVLDGETIRARFDGPHNRLYIIPNHEGNIKDEWMDVDPDDGIEIEEMD